MGVVLPDVEAFQKPVQLTVVKRKNLLAAFRPNESMPLQAFMPDAKPVTVPVKDLDHVSATIAKGKQVPGERIQS